MLEELDTVPVYPLTLKNNIFKIHLTDEEDEQRYVPDYMMAIAYRKGLDPREAKIECQPFDDCSVCCDNECTCERQQPTTVCCPTPYWQMESTRGGLEYVFALDKSIFIDKPGMYVVEIIAPSDQRPREVNVDEGGETWFVLSDTYEKGCTEVEDRVCLCFEFEVEGCHTYEFELDTSGENESLVLDLDVEKIDFPPCAQEHVYVDCGCTTPCGC